MFGKIGDEVFCSEIATVEAQHVDGSSLDRSSQSSHVICCNILRGNQFGNVHMSVEDMIRQWCRFVFGPKESQVDVSFFDLLEHVFRAIEIRMFHQRFSDRLVVDGSESES